MSEGHLSAGRAIDLLADADRALEATLARMSESDLSGPSLCEGWTRAHVLAHLARNAEALSHLVQWAVSGRETPAYASPEQRDADIEEGSRQPLPRLRADVISAGAAFRARVEQLRGRTDLHPVTAGRGGQLEGDQVPWARLREVTYHHVDLDVGFTFAQAPPEVVRAGLAEASQRLGRVGSPPLSLIGTDGRHWHVSGGGTEVHGRPGDLLLWLARGVQHDLTSARPLPTLPAWG